MHKVSERIFTILLLSAMLLTGVISPLFVIPAHAQPPAVILVAPSGSDTTGNGSPGNPYATISHAVNVAPAGAEIIVLPGTYKEMVNITKGVSILSSSGQPSNTIINAAGLMHGIEVLGAGASGTNIEGLTVENANAEGIYVQDASTVDITNNEALNNVQNATLVCPISGTPAGPCINEDKGIELIGTAGSTVAGNTVVGTVGDGGIGLSDDGKLNPGIPQPGPAGAANPSIDNVVAGNTVIANVGGCGIVVSAYNPGEGVIGNVVASNDIVANAEGIVVATPLPGTSAINNTVIGNSVLNSFTEGVDVDSSGGAFAPGNVVSGNSVIGNVVSGNGPDYDFANPHPTGIAVISPTSLMQNGTVVSGNYILNEYYGLAVANATGTTILSNNIASTVKVPILGAVASQDPISSLNSELTGLQTSLSQLQSTAASQSSLAALSGTVSAVNSTLSSIKGTLSQLQASAVNSSGLTTVSNTVNTLNGQLTTLQNSLSQLQSSAAKQSDLSSLSTTVNNVNSQAQTATDLGYAAIVIAVVFGGIAIVLSRRRPAPPAAK
jgi:parallel beta-helix repeat protein